MSEQQASYKTAQWQDCIKCGQEVFTISSPDESICDSCRGLVREHKDTNKRSPKADIPESIRWQVWERDNFTCKMCGTRKDLTVDHVYPEALGGKATLDNCQTLCRRCNSSKGKRL